MTPGKFRELALAVPGAIEGSHMGHADFRLAGKIFATLGYPDDDHGMVKLTPVQQRKWIEKEPAVFSPCAGAWGRGGATSLRLDVAKVAVVRAALSAAQGNLRVKPKRR